MLGRKLLNWFNSQGLNVEILGEFDDAALMKAFGAMHESSLPQRFMHMTFMPIKLS